MLLVTLPLLACAVMASSLSAQGPQYHVTAALQPGDNLDTVLIGSGGQPYASLIDLDGGPRTVLGETFHLGLSAALQTLDAGQLPAGGLRVLRIPTPTAGVLLGVPLYLQSVVLDSNATNGLFATSDGESTVFYRAAAVMVDDFRSPAAEGITGGFDATVLGRLQGAPVERRTHVVMPSGAVPFNAGVTGALNPNGARAQMVYRATDIGGTGQSEELVAIRWRPFQGQVQDDNFQRLVIDVVHSHVVPDYTVGQFSALPVFPGSGLSTTFAQNVKPGDTPVRAFDGSYAIRAANLRADGYLGYPALQQSFTYNGIDSLLLDFRMVASPGAAGVNGAAVYLMVQSSAQPNSRALESGSSGNPVDPFQSTVANMASNTLHDVQLEFAKVRSVAVSPWRAAPVARPNYDAPSVASSVPDGSSLLMEYRGADDASGSNATPWFSNIDFADGQPFLQWRATFVADHRTGGVPSIDAIVIGVN